MNGVLRPAERSDEFKGLGWPEHHSPKNKAMAGQSETTSRQTHDRLRLIYETVCGRTGPTKHSS